MVVVRTARCGRITAGTAASGTLGIVRGGGRRVDHESESIMNNVDHHNLMTARHDLVVLPPAGNPRNAHQGLRYDGSIALGRTDAGLGRTVTGLRKASSRHKVASIRVIHDGRGRGDRVVAASRWGHDRPMGRPR
jgi:hypothetical protein